MKTNKATKQASKIKGAGRGGIIPPKKRRFGEPEGNPRHNGAWKKEDTARYKLEKMMQLTAGELSAICDDDNAPAFERKLARCIGRGEWKEIEGMINQVYGYPKQQVEQKKIEITPILPKMKKEEFGFHKTKGKK